MEKRIHFGVFFETNCLPIFFRLPSWPFSWKFMIISRHTHSRRFDSWLFFRRKSYFFRLSCPQKTKRITAIWKSAHCEKEQNFEIPSVALPKVWDQSYANYGPFKIGTIWWNFRKKNFFWIAEFCVHLILLWRCKSIVFTSLDNSESLFPSDSV